MRRLFANALVVLALLPVAFLLLVRPAMAETPRCTTYQEQTLGRLQTVCANGTRAVSTSHAGWPATATSRHRGAPHHE
jgi:membrane protein implicated in regulation of membrane protease activity